jgi:hypothetical protein
MPGVNIFLSYRRDDAGHAGRLSDHIDRRFPGNIFRDVTGIAPGTDFVRELERKLDSCQVLLVVISKTWLTSANKNGGRRLDDPGDFVRLEVAAGLRRNVCVIPVLVNGAAMPSAADLPDDLKSLANRQAMEVSERDFEDDVLRLCQSIERMFGVAPPKPAPVAPIYTPPPRKRGWLKVIFALGGGAFLMFAFLVVLAALFAAAPQPGGPTTPNSPTTPHSPTSSNGGVVVTGDHLAPADEFFSPVGSWRISDTDDPDTYVDYDLRPGNQLSARLNVASLGQIDAQGQWRYDPGTQQLDMWGTRLQDGVPFREVVRINQKDGDAYAVQHSAYGYVVMSRR